MKTVTLFDAYVKTEQSMLLIERRMSDAKGVQEIGRLIRQLRRRIRQQEKLEARIRVRLVQLEAAMKPVTLIAKTLDGVESLFGIDEIGAVYAYDNVFYIGNVPYALDSVAVFVRETQP